MTNKIFIQANTKQLLGAKIAKYALEKHRQNPASFTVEILNVDEMPLFKKYAGMEFRRGKETRSLDPEDLQFFTLSRFMPPERMGYTGKAIVIDPDIFALVDMSELFDFDLKGNAIAACRKKDAWDSSVMLLDCGALKHWSIEKILEDLSSSKADYNDVMTLRNEHVSELPRIYNSLDVLTPETKMLHTTGRLTQPWKTGLPVDFTRNDPGKLFGIWPRIWDLKLRGKWPTTYQPHPDKNIEKFFFELAQKARSDDAISLEEINREISAGNVRKDFLQYVNN